MGVGVGVGVRDSSGDGVGVGVGDISGVGAHGSPGVLGIVGHGSRSVVAHGAVRPFSDVAIVSADTLPCLIPRSTPPRSMKKWAGIAETR